MKKVDFGFDTSMNPTGSFEGIGLNQVIDGKAVGMTAGNLIGVISRNGNNYLVTEVCECFNNDTRYIGKISVRDTYAYIYPDNSSILYVDLKQSDGAKYLEEWLNAPDIKSKINNIVDVRNITESYDEVPDSFYIALDNENICATGINHDVFLNLINGNTYKI